MKIEDIIKNLQSIQADEKAARLAEQILSANVAALMASRAARLATSNVPTPTPEPARQNTACIHRGRKVGACGCGAKKYFCNLLKIPVRDKGRPDHPADIVCNQDCPKYTVGHGGLGDDRATKGYSDSVETPA